jgi:hypothetical protein
LGFAFVLEIYFDCIDLLFKKEKKKNEKTNLSMKEGCLFVLFVLMRSKDYILDLSRKLLMRRGALAWFHGVWACGVEVLQY